MPTYLSNWVKGETLLPFKMSVSLDLLLLNILKAQRINTTYTPINRQSFEQIWRAHVYGGVAHFISQGIPPPVPRPDICMRMNSSLLMVHVVSECVTQLQTLQSSFRNRQLWQRGLGRDDLYFYQISCWCVSLFQAKKNLDHVRWMTSQIKDRIWQVRIVRLKSS